MSNLSTPFLSSPFPLKKLFNPTHCKIVEMRLPAPSPLRGRNYEKIRFSVTPPSQFVFTYYVNDPLENYPLWKI